MAQVKNKCLKNLNNSNLNSTKPLSMKQTNHQTSNLNEKTNLLHKKQYL